MAEDNIFVEDCVESETDEVPSDADEGQPPPAALPDASQCDVLHQLEQLRAVAIARMECYKKAPTKRRARSGKRASSTNFSQYSVASPLIISARFSTQRVGN